MKYIEELREGDRLSDIYLCKHRQSAVTKNGKSYENVILQDKTGTIDAKIWDPGSAGIEDFDALDYVFVYGDVSIYNGSPQVSIKRISKRAEGEYDPADYLPVSRYPIDQMYQELTGFIDTIQNPYYKKLLQSFFIEDAAFIKAFKMSSAAKAVHHGFVGGLLEHTLSVTKLCNYYTTAYPVLNHDLLLTAAMLHDMGKTRELSCFPENSYTDDGQLLGHIVMGSELISEAARKIPDFPLKQLTELKHCILAHHGEYDYGSPKKPALVEAMALYFADNTDAKMETMTELFEGTRETGWLGFNRYLDSNVRKTTNDL